MYKYAFLILIVTSPVFSQIKKEPFQFNFPENLANKSLYNSINVIDSRDDTSSVGVLQRGLLNVQNLQVPEPTIQKQIIDYFKTIIDNDAKEGSLLLNIRSFRFLEVTGAFSEKGYCALRAELYSKENEKYFIIDKIDEIITVTGMDVTNEILKKSSKLFSSFIIKNLNSAPAQNVGNNIEEVVKIDSLEKKDLEIYKANSYKDGAYTNFTTFVNQTPTVRVKAKIKKENLKDVKLISHNDMEFEPNENNTYAIVFNGIPYIYTNYGFYKLYRKNDDFYFIGKAKETAKSGNVIAASILFGAIGGAIASSAKSEFEMKIDHLNGSFIRVQKK
jgi:hypothetical protein